MAPNTPFYLDWSFWTAAMAAVAILLSQLPPIIRWFRRAVIELEVYSRVLIFHHIGNPNMQLHLLLSNSGGRVAKINNISVRVFREDKEIALMPAKNYLHNPVSKNSFLLTSFYLQPGEEWAHEVNFLNFYSREDEKTIRTAESELRQALIKEKELLENKDKIVRVDKEYVLPFITMFDKLFIWKPGEYKMAIELKTKDSKTDLVKNYRFTLFESDTIDLQKSKEDYATGDGIFWESGNHNPLGVPITEA